MLQSLMLINTLNAFLTSASMENIELGLKASLGQEEALA